MVKSTEEVQENESQGLHSSKNQRIKTQKFKVILVKIIQITSEQEMWDGKNK